MWQGKFQELRSKLNWQCLRRLYNKNGLMDRLSYFAKLLSEKRGYHFSTWVDGKLLDLKDMVLFIDPFALPHM